MRKIAIVLALALVLGGALAMSAQANILNPFTNTIMPNELTNPDFTPDGTGWNTSANVTFNGTQAVFGSGTGYIYQIVDDQYDAAGNVREGWLDNGIGKHFDFSSHFDTGQNATIELELFYYPDNNAKPNFDPKNTGDWVTAGIRSVVLNPGNLFNEADMSVQIDGFQPRWVTAMFTATPTGTPNTFNLNSLDLEAYCKPVPVPASALLLGSGLLGLVGFRFRKNRA